MGRRGQSVPYAAIWGNARQRYYQVSFYRPVFYINDKYDKIKASFDDFIEYFRRVRIIKLNVDNWAKISCSCSWYLKNYSCYHLIAVATHEKLVDIPLEFKNINIEA